MKKFVMPLAASLMLMPLSVTAAWAQAGADSNAGVSSTVASRLDFDDFDRDGDGRVNRAEFGAGRGTSAFIQLDTNDNGTLDAGEFSVWQNDPADAPTGPGAATAAGSPPATRAPANDAHTGTAGVPGTAGAIGTPGTTGSPGVPGTTGSASTRATGNVGGDVGSSAGGSVSGDVGVSGR